MATTMESPDKWLERMCSSLKAFSSYKASEQKFTFMELFRDMAKKHGRERAERGILRAMNDPDRRDRQFIPAPGDFWDYVEKTPTPDAPARLYDDPCRFGCMNGWRDVLFDELRPNRKNKLIEIYGLEKAREHTQVDRCECWKGQAHG